VRKFYCINAEEVLTVGDLSRDFIGIPFWRFVIFFEILLALHLYWRKISSWRGKRV